MTVDSSSRPTIAHVRCVTGYGGGPEKTILNSPRFLAPLGYDSICAYLHPPNDPGFATLEARAAAANAPLVSIPDRGPFDSAAVRRLIRECRERRVAVWHGHDYKSNVAGLIVRMFWPMKLVTTVHGWVDKTRRMPLYDRIDKFALRFYREVMSVSRDLHEQCLALGIPAARCHLIENGIDTQDYRRAKSPADAKQSLATSSLAQHAASVSTDRLLIAAVGRLAKEKGFDLLIEAVRQAIEAGAPIDLWIAGEGAARGELEQQIAALGLTKHVRLLGQVADPRSLYEAGDLYVLSSWREGLPNVVLEAMAMETPVIATRVAGVPDLITEGKTGLLVEPGDVPALRDAILRMANDASLRAACAQQARRRIEQSYSFAERIRREVAIYDRLLGRTETERPVERESVELGGRA